MNRIAVIDIGSNTIKCLVATRSPENVLTAVFEHSLPVRISTGISAENPFLSREALDAGSDAVSFLVNECETRGPLDDVRIVATSAVRDASNREAFCKLVHQRAGYEVKILTGIEEAEFIGRGIQEDPSLKGLSESFCIADLGGGSLELIRFQASTISHVDSLQLGAIRLTERFIPDPKQPLCRKDAELIAEHTTTALQACGFPFIPPLVMTGGVITVWRSMFALSKGFQLNEIPPRLPRENLETWIEQFTRIDWEARKAIPGLPVPRADVIPTAFVTLAALMDAAGTDHLIHSFYNLRYGVASEALPA